IDHQLREMIEVLPVNQAAVALLQQEFDSHHEYDGNHGDEDILQTLRDRIASETREVQQQALLVYAQPVILKQQHLAQQEAA
ncbi:MAG: hypothetical protein ACPGYX_07945, partial [Oceanobacter sp.]